MSDRPILFSAPMVRALLGGRKTQTRRLVPQATQDAYDEYDDWCRSVSAGIPTSRQWESDYFLERTRIKTGDRLWVREKWTAQMTHGWTIADARSRMFREKIIYAADGHDSIDGWWPSIHMPREFSRLTLTVTDVRVQRLQDIREEDAQAEGVFFTDFGTYQPPGTMSIDGGKRFHPFKPRQHDGWHWGDATKPEECLATAKSAYAALWGQINGAGSWDANPWVAAYSFTVEPRNIATLPASPINDGAQDD